MAQPLTTADQRNLLGGVVVVLVLYLLWDKWSTLCPNKQSRDGYSHKSGFSRMVNSVKNAVR